MKLVYDETEFLTQHFQLADLLIINNIIILKITEITSGRKSCGSQNKKWKDPICDNTGTSNTPVSVIVNNSIFGRVSM